MEELRIFAPLGLNILRHLNKHRKKSGKVVLTFESVEETSWCDSSNETCSAILSHGTIILFSIEFQLLRLYMKHPGVTIQVKPIQQCFHLVLLI